MREEKLQNRLSVLLVEKAQDLAYPVISADRQRASRQREDEILCLEREIARLAGLAYAVPLDVDAVVGLRWRVEAGFGMPTLLFCESNGCTVVFQFHRVQETRMGGLTAEVLASHELFGRGLDACGLFEVRNSRWKAELQRGNAAHAGFDINDWNPIRHFLFRDQGGEFGCLAVGGDYWVVDVSWQGVTLEHALASRANRYRIPVAPERYWSAHDAVRSG